MVTSSVSSSSKPPVVVVESREIGTHDHVPAEIDAAMEDNNVVDFVAVDEVCKDNLTNCMETDREKPTAIKHRQTDSNNREVSFTGQILLCFS